MGPASTIESSWSTTTRAAACMRSLQLRKREVDLIRRRVAEQRETRIGVGGEICFGLRRQNPTL